MRIGRLRHKGVVESIAKIDNPFLDNILAKYKVRTFV